MIVFAIFLYLYALLTLFIVQEKISLYSKVKCEIHGKSSYP